MKDNSPLVSICMVTYNHERFIAKAIESVVHQVGDFDVQLVIGEDCSTDNTRAVCEEYAEKYPDKILLLAAEKNMGMMANVLRVIAACKGKYAATLDGDDYWTDENKLQKQVDFLENNPDYSMCFASIEVLDESNGEFSIAESFRNFKKDTYTIEDYITAPLDKPLLIPGMTLLNRTYPGEPLPEFYKRSKTPDIATSLLLFNKGKGRYMNETMAVYRQHGGGISKNKKFDIELDKAIFDLFDDFNEFTHHKYHELMKPRQYELSKLLLMYGSSLLKGKRRMNHIFKMLKGYKKYRSGNNSKELLYFYIVLFFPFLLKFHKIGSQPK